MKIRAYIIAATLFLTASTLLFSQQISGAQVRSAYIYRFTQGISWSNESSLQSFNIGVLGQASELKKELEKLASSEKIKGLDINIVQLNSINFNPSKLQMLYVSKDYNVDIKSIFKNVERSNTLLVTEQCNDKENIMINFILPEKDRIDFEINKTNLDKEKLEMSSEFLLYAGNKFEISSLYKELEKTYNTIKVKLDSSQKVIKDQSLKISNQKKEISNQLKEISSNIETIKNLDEKSKKQEDEIQKRIQELTFYEDQLNSVQSNLEKANIDYDKYEKLIDSLNVRIDQNKHTLQIQYNEIIKQNDLISTQKSEMQMQNELTEMQDSTIRSQRILIYGSIAILILIAILLYFLNKNRLLKIAANKQLNDQNKLLDEKRKESIEHAIELKSTLDELKETQNILVQSEKMASLGVLTAGIAHEINNPINFVSVGSKTLDKNFKRFIQYVENIEKSDNKEELEELKQKFRYDDLKTGLHELIEDINIGAERTSNIIQGLRNFYSGSEDKTSFYDIHVGIDATLLILNSKLKDNFEVVKEFDPELGEIQCYPGLLNQVLMNLISNAIDACNGTGTIKIQTKKTDDEVTISVIDNGSGITEKDIENIFDPFFTTKETGKGTGLGLSISFGIVQKHNGNIKVKSEIGKGTEFIVTLPKKLTD